LKIIPKYANGAKYNVPIPLLLPIYVAYVLCTHMQCMYEYN